ncbi:capsule-associated protein CAP1 [Terramyces sp. JEL0728]|nr:capsule-associated protein CAP1 [Terramyces sp. JEL0728]
MFTQKAGYIGGALSIIVDLVGLYGAYQHRPGYLKAYAGIKTVALIFVVGLTIFVLQSNSYKQSVSDDFKKNHDSGTTFDDYYRLTLIVSYTVLAINTLFSLYVILCARSLWKFYKSPEELVYKPTEIQKERKAALLKANQYLNQTTNFKEFETFGEFSAYYKQEFKRSVPYRMDRWFEFAKEKQCSFAPSLYKALYKDLQPFRDAGGISNEMIDVMDNMGWMSIYKVKDGKYVKYETQKRVFWNGAESFLHHLPDMTFYINWMDEPRVLKNPPKFNGESDRKRILKTFTYHDKTKTFESHKTSIIDFMKRVCDKGSLKDKEFNLHGFFISPWNILFTAEKVPVFSMTSIEGCFSDIVIPVWWHFNSDEELPKGALDKPWSEKKDSLSWRGSLTGQYITKESDWKNTHRIRLLKEYGYKGTKHFEPALVRTTGGDAFDQSMAQEIYTYIQGISKKVDPKFKFINKYNIDVDGTVFTERFLGLLRFKVLSFKMTIFRDWVTDKVKPWKHYIPIDITYDDLKPKYFWAKDHQLLTNAIVSDAHDYAKKYLRKADMECYMFRLLLEYYDLLPK